MADASLQIGNGNWAVKPSLLLGYNIISNRYNPIETDFTRATGGTRTNELGLIDYKNPNIARINYESGVGSLLLEPQRTNLSFPSNDFGDVSWDKVYMNVASSSVASPFANTNATLLTANNQYSSLQQFPSVGIGTYTTSYYVKYINQQFITIVQQGTSQAVVTFDLINGTVNLSNGGLYVGSSIKSVGNGWYRISLTINVPTSNFTLASSLWFGLYSATNYSGSQVYAFGAQCESGSYASSYIPTTNASMTRNQDVISSNNISSSIGQTEGTIYLEYAPLSLSIIASSNIISIRSADSTNSITLYFDVYNNFPHLTIAISKNSAFTYYGPNIPLTNLNFRKLALVYKSNSIYLFENGIKIENSNATGVTFPFSSDFTNLFLADQNAQGARIKNVQIYKTALSDSECIALTT